MLTIVIPGEAQVAGSKSYRGHRGGETIKLDGKTFRSGGKPIIADSNPDATGWKRTVGWVALQEMRRLGVGCIMKPQAVRLDVEEVRQRPGGHWTAAGVLSAEGLRHPFPTKYPDRGKTLRPVEDGLSKILYEDDSQVVTGLVSKRYAAHGESAHVRVTVWLETPLGSLEIAPSSEVEAVA